MTPRYDVNETAKNHRTMTLGRHIRTLIMGWMAIGWLALLSGCDFGAHSTGGRFDDYLSRVANVQDKPALDPPDAVYWSLPAQSDIRIDIAATTIGLLDSYELRKCGLFHLIAEKNSSLGKVQDEFANFDYQTELLRGIQRCINAESLSPALVSTLSTLLPSKEAQLRSHWFNLLYTSDAMRQQLQVQDWLSPSNGFPDERFVTALQTLADISELIEPRTAWQYAHPIRPHQEVLDKQLWLGNVLFSLQNSTLWLDTITKQLHQYDDAIVCGAGLDTTRYRYLRNVFQSIYIEKVQPELSYYDKLYYALEPHLTFLTDVPLDPAYPIDRAYQAYRQATLEHVKYWQQLFARCGDSPR